MLSRRTFVAAAAVVMLPFGKVVAEAPPEQVQGAVRFIASLGDQAITALRANSRSLEQREATFRGLLAQGFDVPFIGRFVLGRYWRQASAEQRSDYIALFCEFLLKTYSRRLGGSTGETFTVTGARPTGRQHITVRTRIERPIRPPGRITYLKSAIDSHGSHTTQESLLQARWRWRTLLEIRFRYKNISVSSALRSSTTSSPSTKKVSAPGPPTRMFRPSPPYRMSSPRFPLSVSLPRLP